MRLPFFIEQAETAQGGGAVPSRSQIDDASKWDLSSVVESDEAWERLFEQLEDAVKPVEAMKGKLTSVDALVEFFEVDTTLDRHMERLYTYAHLRSDEDTTNTDGQAREDRIRAAWASIAGRLAWITPELLANPVEDLEAWAEDDRLKENRYAFIKLIRRKPHVLSDKEETLLSRAGEIFSGSHKVYSLLTDADMKFPAVEDEHGRELELSQERYILFLKSRSRDVRKSAFDAMYTTYGSFRNTLAATLGTNVKYHNYMASTRGFDSSLASSLHNDQVPVKLYETLIDAVHQGFPHFYEYTKLRAGKLQLEKLDMFDHYVPIVKDYDMDVPFGQAREWVTAACEPLGVEYMDVLKSCFDEGWIDIYENRGKRSGAYASGCYDSHPYVLLNYQGTLNDVFTLAHELGHAMHSYLANKTQPHRFASYPIFIAEIASTLNESLLLKMLLSQADDERFKAYLLNHYCDAVKGTVYRQTMFAEYEKLIHEMDAQGIPLTADALSEAYYKMNAQYYGPAVEADRQIAWEWARIPHFYYNFYVYKYATSFCASEIFSRRVLESEAQREQYLDLLRAGGSDDPLVLIRKAGVDLEDRATLESALTTFGGTVQELSSVLL